MDYKGAEPRLEHVFDIRINFEHRWIWGPIHPGGPNHGFTSVLSGVIEGPRLNGRVVEGSGADFPVVRTDGVIELNAHYMLEADDGAQIYIRNIGYVVPPKEGRPAYFYMVLKRGLTYNFYWLMDGGEERMTSWALPAGASKHVRVTIALDGRGSGRIVEKPVK